MRKRAKGKKGHDADPRHELDEAVTSALERECRDDSEVIHTEEGDRPGDVVMAEAGVVPAAKGELRSRPPHPVPTYEKKQMKASTAQQPRIRLRLFPLLGIQSNNL